MVELKAKSLLQGFWFRNLASRDQCAVDILTYKLLFFFLLELQMFPSVNFMYMFNQGGYITSGVISGLMHRDKQVTFCDAFCLCGLPTYRMKGSLNG